MYHLTVGEMGIDLSPIDRRGADISIFNKVNFKLTDKYADIPPEIIIEIDVRADVGEGIEMDYVAEKTDDYHRFGVKRIIWILRRPRKNHGQCWPALAYG
ncbi:MAG: hypothetical protein IPM82_23995 [Saprospiraceae bacterium]|nr:hypothetical protein [Saprospiraceae bacterium]